jgi:hypothetical protein
MLLWKDLWSQNCLQHSLPRLFSFSKDESITVVADMQALQLLPDHFHLPILVEALAEFNQLHEILGALPDLDQWLVFGSELVFKVVEAYKRSMGQHMVSVAIKWIWSSCCQSKHKVFFLLNRRKMLQRKNFFMPTYLCEMCNGGHLESRDHLFFSCPFGNIIALIGKSRFLLQAHLFLGISLTASRDPLLTLSTLK